MNIIIAMDSFKGSLSAKDAVYSVREGILRTVPDANISVIPMADGGEGTVDAIISALGGEKISVNVKNPIEENIKAQFGIVNSDTAVIELAAASGLTLIDEEKRNPLYTTTYGTGQLIKKALELGIKKIILGLGGSATNDGGIGLAQALGIKFFDNNGDLIKSGGRELERIADIDIAGINPLLASCEINILCDVLNPLCGQNGAAYLFAGQKGANDEEIERLDKGLFNFGNVIKNKFNMDFLNLPGAGAAGGSAVPLLAFCNAKLKSGIDIILDMANFDEKLKDADLIITGEGMLDNQTVFGKVPVGVAKRAKKFGLPVVALVGKIGSEYEKVYDYGIDSVFSIQNGPMSLEESISDTKKLLADCANRVMKLVCSLKG